MSTLADLWHYFGGDLAVASNGDLQTVTGTLRGQQRVLRRLLTNPGGYLFEPTYGAGLPSFIGLPLDVPKLTALIRSQMALEDSVAQLPAPVISVSATADPSAFAVSLQYNDADTGAPVILSFPVAGNT
jgi:hypothetical protein